MNLCLSELLMVSTDKCWLYKELLLLMVASGKC